MKTKLLIIALAVSFNSAMFAQTKEQIKHKKAIEKSKLNNTVEISMDTVFLAGKAMSLFKFSEKNNEQKNYNIYITRKYYDMKTLKGVVLANACIVKSVGVTVMSFEFPALQYRLEVTDSKWNEEKLLKAMYDCNVFADNKANAEGLKTLQTKYGFNLMTLEEYQKALQAQQQQQQMDAQKQQQSQSQSQQNTTSSNSDSDCFGISFSIKNNCSNTVYYFVGTVNNNSTGSGQHGNASGNTISSESGNCHEKLCICDQNRKPVSCTSISKGMGTVYINKSGTGFGNF